MKIKSYSMSDIGNFRKNNQDFTDTIQLKNGDFLSILCDGMGGHAHGEIASKTVTKTLIEYFKKTDFSEMDDKDVNKWIRKSILKIIDKMKKMVEDDESLYDMGTTIVSLMIVNNRGYILNIGDSRIYSFDAKTSTLKQLTIDQNLYNSVSEEERKTRNALGDFGNRMSETIFWKILTSALGPYKKIKIDTYLLKKTNATFLITSDGVHDYIDEETMIEILDSPLKLKQKVSRIIGEAKANVSTDNLTAVLVEVNK